MNFKIPLSRPDITRREIQEVTKVLKSGILSIGRYVEEFEERLARFLGVRYVIATSSGTTALHLIIRALNIKDGDEVITTPFSFVASSNCILFERAKPVFVDINEQDLNIDVEKIESAITDKTKAILIVHIFGYPCNMDRISEIAAKHNLLLIEDACEALGASYKGKMCGSFGVASAFGFYPNKQITTGEGGAIATNNKEIAFLCQSMRNQGRDHPKKWLEHNRLGYNYRLDEMSAAVGVVQMKRIKSILKRRNQVAEYYVKKLRDVSGLILPPLSNNSIKRSWFVFVIRLKEQALRSRLIQKFIQAGIQTNIYFPSIHLQDFYRDFGYKKGDFPIAEKVSNSTIALPFYNKLKTSQQDYIIEKVKSVVE